MNQEALIQASMFENQIKETEQHLEFISSQIIELKALEENISSLHEAKEILSSLGKGIYLKAKPEEKNLFVSVGSGIIVKKSPEKTSQTIKEQIERLSVLHNQLSSQIQAEYMQMNSLIAEIESSKQ